MAFQLPRLDLRSVLIDTTGKATTLFQRWWQTVCDAIEAQETGQNAILSQIQASLALSGSAVVGNDASSGAAKSGQAAVSSLSIVDATWVHGPTVALTGVTAGMTHLTLTGSAPTSGVIDGGPVDGEYRVQEIVGIVETTVFTGTFTARTTVNGDTVISLGNPVNSTVFTRSATGALSYRLDVRKVAGTGVCNSTTAYLFARRAP